jgi:hypothetical protein
MTPSSGRTPYAKRMRFRRGGGDQTELLWKVLDNHQTQDYDQAVAVLQDVLNMDNYSDMADHYRWPDNWKG